MSKSPNYLIDTNVWVALFLKEHAQHEIAKDRLAQIALGEACFCRATQKGLLRLLTQPAATFGNPIPMNQSWWLYEQHCQLRGIVFLGEPEGIEQRWRALTTSPLASPKLWMDAYLQAFAELAGLKIITFDRPLAKASGGECLLGGL